MHSCSLALFCSELSSLGVSCIAQAAPGGGYPPAPPVGPPPHQIVDPAKDCGGACDVRCGAHSRKNRCTRACLTCCKACRCVPAGTAGNQETCGKCYTDWTTHGNRTKCP
ncbi:hypothetical protein PVAP13_7KG195800 [Panicum virgatum]|uniref:Uncharacterized protein n=1 Tax=Panicum virgatum TaxID=38727 RepID=A0A8T0QHJ7_PANVG|nr:hypothetical protein PVAP13_7KG195800 [Panicum virgatum]